MRSRIMIEESINFYSVMSSNPVFLTLDEIETDYDLQVQMYFFSNLG